MTTLTESLEQFVRKERNLLIREILGHSQHKPLLLDDEFRNQIAAALDQPEIPRDAWWATDFHLNWIAGALSLWHHGNQIIGTDQKNYQTEDSQRWLIERNQEDTDLLIVTDKLLVLVEVKAFGYFTNKQIGSKVDRWRLLKNWSESRRYDVEFRFVLMSPTEPTNLHPPPPDLLPNFSKWPHVRLKLHASAQRLKVSGRKPGKQALAAYNDSWFIVPVPRHVDEDDDEYSFDFT